jgi:hypothetical protein
LAASHLVRYLTIDSDAVRIQCGAREIQFRGRRTRGVLERQCQRARLGIYNSEYSGRFSVLFSRGSIEYSARTLPANGFRKTA